MSARILIADDSRLILKSLRNLLESQPEGWSVCAEAIDGPQALEKALQTKPDLIIIDFQMPVMDGLRTALRIARLLPAVPILINSLYKSSFLDAEAQKVGVREVVLKSDTGALLRAANKILGTHMQSPKSHQDKPLA